MKKLLAGLPIVGLLVIGLALPAVAHSFQGEGDCDGWTLYLDGTWNAYDITVDGVSIGLDQVVTIPDTSDNEERTFVVRWWKEGPDVTRTVTVTRVLDCLTEQPISIGGDCLIDQAGVARAIYSAEGRPGAEFTVNGVNIGGAIAGGIGVFGENTWSVTAIEGYEIVGPSEGSFVIEDCTPATTTTTQPTTTTVPEATTSTPTTTPTTVATTAPEEAPPVELPFTGIDRGQLIALGSSGLVLGVLLVVGARSREEEISS